MLDFRGGLLGYQRENVGREGANVGCEQVVLEPRVECWDTGGGMLGARAAMLGSEGGMLGWKD